MLILDRHPGEKIIIGSGENRICFMVTRIIDTDLFEVGIDAPPHLNILRLSASGKVQTRKLVPPPQEEQEPQE